MPTFSNDPTHPLLEKLDNTEVIEVEAESGRSQPAHKHVNLTIIAIKIVLSLNVLQTVPMLVVSPSVSVMNWEEGRKMEIAQTASQKTRMDTPEELGQC